MELWKDIEGYEGLYQVSDKGRIKSLKRYVSIFEGVRVVVERFLNSSSKLGYPSVCLAKEGSKKYKQVHRLVAIAFIPNPEGKNQVNHKNGIKIDSYLKNLEWCTPKENCNHAIRTKLTENRGEMHTSSKLTKNDVISIRRDLSFCQGRELAKKYNVTPALISRIKKRQNWKHI
jgi:hypothetical protein